MIQPRFLQVDVFGARPGTGNPLGVVVGAEGWPDAAMQSFARWTNLVETTFVLPSTRSEAHYRLRIFTPAREIPFAGHPTIGSAHVVLKSGVSLPGPMPLVQECGAGLLPIRTHAQGLDHGLAVRAPPAREIAASASAKALLPAACRGLRRGAIAPTLVEGGRSWWIAEAHAEEDLRAWQPNHPAILDLARASNALGLCIFARTGRQDYQLAVRAFPAAVGIIEDPASGAANGLIASLIASREPESDLARRYRVSQGREIGHDALIEVEFDAEGGVWVGGNSHILIDGRLDWSENIPPR